jgi:hypothetical protein
MCGKKGKLALRRGYPAFAHYVDAELHGQDVAYAASMFALFARGCFIVARSQDFLQVLIHPRCHSGPARRLECKRAFDDETKRRLKAGPTIHVRNQREKPEKPVDVRYIGRPLDVSRSRKRNFLRHGRHGDHYVEAPRMARASCSSPLAQASVLDSSPKN